jgi:hypothetical protein
MKTVIRTTSAGRKLGLITSIVTLRGGFAATAIAIGCLLMLSANYSTAALHCGNPNPGIAPPDSRPLGLSYNRWVELADQWLYSFPTTISPSPTRVFGDMVVPPQGGFTGAIVPVTMEADQWLYVPICFNTWLNTPGDPGWDSNTRWSHAPFTDPNTGITYHTYEAWVREVMKEYVDTLTPTSTIDGKPVRDLDMYRMQTGLFDITVPEDNAWDSSTYYLPPGTYGPALVDGWFAILHPMTPGKHTVVNTVTDASGATYSLTYDITVTRGKGHCGK